MEQFYLHHHICNDNQERIGNAEEQPDLHRFNVRSVGKGHGDRHVDGGEHHHAGDVHRDDQVILGVPGDVVGGLVDDVHQKRGNVVHHDNVKFSFGQGNSNSYYILRLCVPILYFPTYDVILAN